MDGERKPLPPPPDEPGRPAGDDADEITLGEDEWPVAEHYRVKPRPQSERPAANERDKRETVVATEPTRPTRASRGTPARQTPVRRFPPDLGPGLLLALLAALLLIPAGYFLATRGTDKSERQATDTTNTAPPRTDTTDATTTSPTPTRNVPEVVGLALREARQTLQRIGFRVRTRFESSDRPEGEVLAQQPRGGSEAEAKSAVVLTVSRGPERVTVPDVVGKELGAATNALRKAGLQPEIRERRSNEPPGTVIAQTPAGGEEVEPQTRVRLQVATAPPRPSEPAKVEVPDVVGLTAAEAKRRLRESGLRWTTVDASSDEPKGTVVGQSPGAGARVERRHAVTLRVSRGPSDVVVPVVIGLDEQVARQQLEAAGFRVRIIEEPTVDVGEDGVVIAQDPLGGTEAPKGSAVTLTVARL